MEHVFYEDVFRALNRYRVRYLIVGGVAVNLSGVPRMTKDLDLMLDLSADNLKSFLAAVKELGYRPRAPVALEDFADADKRTAWRREKGAVVFLENPIDFESAYKAKQPLEAGDMTLSVISIEDLIRLKALANRLQDKSDIAMLRKVQDERRED
jgi:predicted nucleotidyltransferase